LPKPEVFGKSLKLLLEAPPKWAKVDKGTTVDLMYWFFGALLAAQVDQGAAARLKPWLETLHRTLRDNQQEDGSWDPVGPWGALGGRIYSTAFGALILLAPVRYPRGFGDMSIIHPPYEALHKAIVKATKHGDIHVRTAALKALERIESSGGRR
jgi:hypothetical protein